MADRKKFANVPWLQLICLGLVILFIVSTVQTCAPNVDKAPEAEVTLPNQAETFTLTAVGDITVTQEILGAARTPDGYDFTPLLLPVASCLGQGDLTVGNLELNLTAGTPEAGRRLAPFALAQALEAAGMDLVQTANSKAIAEGLQGLQTTLSLAREAGLEPVGTFTDSQDFRRTGGVTLVEKNGLRICFLAFTKGLDNMSLPEGADDCVNLLYTDYATKYSQVNTDRIQQVLQAARAMKPDLTIALLHWGSEYVSDISSTMEDIENLLLAGGVDAIIGSHSHLVGPLVEKEYGGRKVFIAYSLGNFLDYDTSPGANAGAVLHLTFARNASGTMEYSSYTWDPVYMASGAESPSGFFQILDLNNAIALYEENYFSRVSQETYESLLSAREKLLEQVLPPED